MQTRRRRPWWRSRWWTPLLSLALGGVVFAAMAIGGDPAGGLKSFGVLAAVAAVFWFGRRSDTLRGLGGPGRDERWSMIDLRATAMSGVIVLLALTGAWLWELAHGDDGAPYGRFLAVGGLSYIAAVAFLRGRT